MRIPYSGEQHRDLMTAWSDVLFQVADWQPTSEIALLPYWQADPYFYEVFRKRCLSNVYTHSHDDQELSHVQGDLSDIAVWKELKLILPPIDYVVGSAVPLSLLSFVLLYGYKLAVKGVLLSATDVWLSTCPIARQLKAPVVYKLTYPILAQAPSTNKLFLWTKNDY